MKSKKTQLSKGQVTQEKLLESACSLFLEAGFHAATTREITNQMEMSPSSLYSHFVSKEEIFEAVLYKYHPWLVIPEAVERAEGHTIEEIVQSSSGILLNEWDKKPEYIRLHLIELLEFKGKHLPDLFDTTFQNMVEAVNRLIKSRQGLDTIDVDVLARALLGLFFAYLMTDRYTGMEFYSLSDASAFDYFKDSYLQAFFSKEVDE